MTITPYEWQVKDVEALKDNNFIGLVNSQPGAGKTVVAVECIRQSGAEVTLIIAPKSTHTTAWAPTVKTMLGQEARIVGRGRKAEKLALADFEMGYPGVYLITPQLFTRSDVSTWVGDMLIVDECFEGDTTVSTPAGERKIRDIQPGDEVYGYDHQTGRVEVTTVKAKSRTQRKTLPAGVTPNHPVYVVGWGYTPYADLTEGDRGIGIVSGSSKVREVPLRVFSPDHKEKAEVLFEEVCDGPCEGQPESRSESDPEGGSGVFGVWGWVRGSTQQYRSSMQSTVCGGCGGKNPKKTPKGNRVFELRRNFSAQAVQGSKVLFNSVLKNALGANPRRGGASAKAERGHEGAQPHEGPRGEGSCSEGENVARGGNSGRKWEGKPHRETLLGRIARRLGVGGFARDRRGGEEHRVSEPLQDRLCCEGGENRSGNRRREPQFLRKTGTGLPKRGVPHPDGLDPLAILQPRSAERYFRVREYCGEGEKWVYNLETGTENYFAGGVLVHNCHMLGNPGSKGQRKLSGFTSPHHDNPVSLRFPMRLALSGTPMRNTFDRMWSITRLLWPELDRRGQIAHINSFMWKHDRMTSAKIRTGYDRDAGKAKEAIQWLREREPGKLLSEMPCVVGHYRRDKCCEYHPDGFLSLDEPQEIVRTIELTSAQKKAIKDLQEHAIAWIEDNPLVSKLPITTLTRIRQLCLGEPTVTWDWDEEREEDVMNVEFAPDCKSPMIDEALEILDSLDEGEPVVVYMESARFARVAAGRFREAGYRTMLYSGQVNSKARNEELKAFGTNDGAQILVGVLSAISTGTDGAQRVANTEIWMERSLDPTINIQAEARLDRMGARAQVQRFIIQDDTGFAAGRLGREIEKRLEIRKSTMKGVA